MSVPASHSMPVEVSNRVTGGRNGTVRLPIPAEGRWAAEEFVADHLGHLLERRRPTAEARSSLPFRGGQRAADDALENLVVTGYDRGRRTVYPQPRRTVSRLSPWIRHGLLSLQRVWDSVEGGYPDDVAGFRRALLHQEYARHLYARLGPRLRHLAEVLPSETAEAAPGGRRQVDEAVADEVQDGLPGRPEWDRRMGCLDLPLDELEEDGWLVDEARRWLAAHRARQAPLSWTRGEEHFHRHLLDGSRAANTTAWLHTLGLLGAKPRPFSRWDVEELAPGLCASCELVTCCPIERIEQRSEPGAAIDLSTASASTAAGAEALAVIAHDPYLTATTGPLTPEGRGDPEQVWLTAESLGDADPALAAHPDLPAVFVFDQPLLAQLRISSARLSFLVETLAELATRRRLELWLGDPTEVLAGRRLAATFTPVPGWRKRADVLDIVVRHPWPWFRQPDSGRIDSFDCWNRLFS